MRILKPIVLRLLLLAALLCCSTLVIWILQHLFSLDLQLWRDSFRTGCLAWALLLANDLRRYVRNRRLPAPEKTKI